MSSSSERRSSLPNAEQQLGSTNNDAESVASSRSDASNWRNRFRYSPLKRPFVIGVAGGTASGKSTVCSKIMEKLGPGIDPTSKSKYLSHEKRVVVISQDSFYRKLTDHDRNMVTKGNFNFDHPSAFDVDLMVRTLRDIIYGKMVKIPIYNYLENEISDELEVVYPADVVLVEGLLLFYFPEVRELFNMKIFVDTDPDTRLARRVMRDVNTHKRDIEWVLSQYTKFVKPSFEEFCLPTKKHADIIVPRGNDNEVAIDLIVQTIRDLITVIRSRQSIDSGRRRSRGNNNSHADGYHSTPSTPVPEGPALTTHDGEQDSTTTRIRHYSDSRQDISYNRTKR